MGIMKLTDQPMFPSVEAMTDWLARNCEQCRRGRHRALCGNTTDGEEYTKPTCTVNKDVLNRQQDPLAKVAYQSCRRVQNTVCPLRKPIPEPPTPLPSLF